jgi:hypothetical protein
MKTFQFYCSGHGTVRVGLGVGGRSLIRIPEVQFRGEVSITRNKITGKTDR